MKKTGLILEGGAMRGLFSAGIMDVLMENNIQFDGIIGVSAGATFGCNYKSHQPGRVLRYNKKFCRDRRFCSWHSLLTTGDLFGADFCYRELPLELDRFDSETFNSDPTEFYMVCTNVNTGLPHYQLCSCADEKSLEWMRASASMPLVSRIVKIDDNEYLDGAITDSIPLKFFEQSGFERNVVILTQPPGYIKKPIPAMWLMRAVFRKYPAFIKALSERHNMYNVTLQYIENALAAGKIFVFRPEAPLPAQRICRDPKLLQKTYDLGRVQAEKELKNLQKYLAD